MASARITDVNGYYEVPRNPISRIGVFPYTKRSIEYPGWQADPDGIVSVYRPAEELGDPQTIASFRLVPWINEHAMLGNPETDPALVAPEVKGVHGTTGEQVEFDPTDGVLYANLKLWSNSLQAAIDAGKKELSMGFRCMYEFVQGIFEGQAFQAIQRNLRANHGASVPHGRMGPGVAVLDHLTFAFDASELREVKPMAKVKRRVKVASKLGVAVDALPAYFGMDAADIPAAALAKWNATMDAEEDDGEGDDAGKSGMTLEDIADMLGEVGPAMAKINEALAAMAGAPAGDPADTDGVMDDDDMEPVLDAAGQPVTDPATGKPAMKKKAAPVADKTPAFAAMDAAIDAMAARSTAAHKLLKGRAAPPALASLDAAITTAKGNRAKITARRAPKTKGNSAMDEAIVKLTKVVTDFTSGGGAVRAAMDEMAGRDVLAKKVSAYIGAFDHAKMTTQDVAVYAAGKFGIKPAAGQEITAVESYIHNRPVTPPASAASFGLDSAPGSAPNKIGDLLAGRPVKAA